MLEISHEARWHITAKLCAITPKQQADMQNLQHTHTQTHTWYSCLQISRHIRIKLKAKRGATILLFKFLSLLLKPFCYLPISNYYAFFFIYVCNLVLAFHDCYATGKT